MASVKAYSTRITCDYSNAVRKYSKQGKGDLEKLSTYSVQVFGFLIEKWMDKRYATTNNGQMYLQVPLSLLLQSGRRGS